jgi:hypothetical protein
MALPVVAQWNRTLYSGKGGSSDVPSPHSLGYFTRNPFLRDDGDDLCSRCSPADKAASARIYTARSEVKPVGSLAGYRIVDVLYYIGARGEPSPAQAKWKAILVQVGPDLYREIFHLSAYYTTISIAPSRIVQAGDERVLATMDSDGGNGGGCWEGYWWFDRLGPHALDFSPLEAAIRAGVPANTTMQVSCANLNLDAQEVRSGVQRTDAECHACGWIGSVIAKFRLDGATAIPVSITFQPDVQSR